MKTIKITPRTQLIKSIGYTMIAVITICGCSCEDERKIAAMELEETESVKPKNIDSKHLQKRNGIAFEVNQEDPYTGFATFYYMNGQKKEEVMYQDGKKHGKTTKWYENGQKKEERMFKDGKRHGKSTFWYKNGNKKDEMMWKDGELHGKTTFWYKNGNKKGEGMYQDGELHGKFTLWYENGQKEAEGMYKDGKLKWSR